MRILIQGMKMPMNCDVCPFDNKLYCVAYAPSKDMIYDISDGRPDWCPLIELPPHGRLIDADALMLRVDCHGTNKFGMLDEDIREFIGCAPTIIPAAPEGGADNG